MLQSLNIKNVALIKDLSLDFGPKFNVLLGETGAGKSIIFDALNFVLGGKVTKELLRSGENFMKVDALFGDLKQPVVDELENLGVAVEDGQVLLSRQYNADGRTAIRINGVPAVASTLKSVGMLLVDSYSQHESLDLLKNKNHLALLDKFGGRALREIKDEVKDRFERYQNTIKQIDELGGDEFERERTKSLLEYQIKEIEDADLHVGEDEEVKAQLLLMSNAEKIAEAVGNCSELLQNSSCSALSNVQNALSSLNNINNVPELEEFKSRLESAKIELQDISESLVDLSDNLNFSEFELERLDKRNDLIKSLLKKYGGTIEQVLAYLQSAKERYNKLCDAESELQRLEILKTEQERALGGACDSLTAKRKEVAKVIEGRVVKELAELNMKNTTFVVNFEKLSNFTSNGNDDVSFAFSANKGQEVKALSKTASGGEMSRFMLAIKNIFAEFGSAQTLIFDEIDAGISGETGVVVGEKLSRLAQAAQVICITHLPQVAAVGDNFFYVSKATIDNNTLTSVKTLDEEGVIYELARMVGGNNVTETALNHSKELRNRAKDSH